MSKVRIQRLASGDRAQARRLFATMAEVFGENGGALGDLYLDGLLNRHDFWAMAAFIGDEIVGGVTAHTLPMTRVESSEIFIYDIAVSRDHQRQGIGRQLMRELAEAAAQSGIREIFVLADNDDPHALDFYRALGGTPSPVTLFSFSRDGRTEHLEAPVPGTLP